MKKLTVAFSVMLILVPAIVNAAAATPESMTPQGGFVTFDLQLTDKIKALLMPMLDQAKSELDKAGESLDSVKAENDKSKTFLDILEGGNRIFVSAQSANEILMFLPVTQAQWETLIKGSEKKETYGGSDIYSTDTEQVSDEATSINDDEVATTETVSSGYATYIDGFVVAVTSSKTDSLHHVIDLASGKLTDSLSNDTAYTAFTSDYLFPHFLSFTVNYKKIFAEFAELTADSKELTEFNKLTKIETEGASFAETPTGYAFNIKIKGDQDAIKADGYSFNPAGSFTPHFYTQFPGGKPIFYIENTNTKAAFDQAKKTLVQLNTSMNLDIEKSIKDATGFTIDDLFAPLTKEVGFAVQYDKDTMYPLFSFMANVKDNPASGKKIIDALAKGLSKKERGLVSVAKEKGFTIFTIKTKPDATGSTEISFTAGVTNDDLLIISNYPDIRNAATRTGLQTDTDFAAAASSAGSVTGFVYINLRTFWAWLDGFLASQATSIEDYNSYYQALQYLYGGKEIVITAQGDDYNTAIHGTVTVDSAMHAPLSDLIKTLKTEDTNDDGVNDYDSLYIYHTPVNLGADEETPVNLIEQLNKGVNPTTGTKLFNDLPEDSYYNADVSSLKLGGTINGYADGSFKPEKSVTRAEFISMVVKAFNVPRAAKFSYFRDVSYKEWYVDAIDRAFSAGIITGSTVDGELVIRPNDTITRAEAAVILSRAGQTLKSDTTVQSCSDAPFKKFKDVNENDWFCGAVAKAYGKDIVKGKSADKFGPYDLLTRADAAVLIQRTLKQDIQNIDIPAKPAPLELPTSLIPSF